MKAWCAMSDKTIGPKQAGPWKAGQHQVGETKGMGAAEFG